MAAYRTIVVLLSRLIALPLAQLAEGQGVAVHHGRHGEIAVAPPRLEAEITIDGSLDDPE